MRTANTLSISYFLGILAVCAPCVAQPAAPPAKPVAQAMTEKARQLFAEGVKAYQQSRWADAHASFLAAWALTKHYSIAGNLADCELKLGLYREAAEHFARYVREMSKDATSTPQERKDGEARYAQARARVAQAELRINVAGAEVYVDGKLIGTAPLEDPVFLDPGSHTIEARSDGYPPARGGVEARVGVSAPVTLTLERLPDQPPQSKSSGPGRGWMVATGVLAAGGLGAGIGLTAAANGKSADAASMRGGLGGQRTACTPKSAMAPGASCVTLKDTLRSESTLSRAAIGSYVTGGALVMVATGLGVWHARAASSPKASASLRVMPAIGADGAGMTVLGQW